MRILELTNFSAGVCGVFARVSGESELLSKKHEVKIFSSDFVKGSNERAAKNDHTGKVEIRRFRALKLGGESFMYWNFAKDAIEYDPDIIIAHGYRHFHTTQALKIASILKIPCILVTHAPFVEGNTSRSFIETLAVKFYDSIIGKLTINKFSKVAIIADWEREYLKKIGLHSNKVVYLPNGISEEYFSPIKKKENNSILFLGRISPIKDIETLLKSFALIQSNSYILNLVGPAEREYLSMLKELVKNLNITNRVKFKGPVYNLKAKIRLLDESKMFILPSKKEGQPQALIEAMARGKVVIASNNQGCRAIIKNGVNGFLFEIGKEKQLAKIIQKIHTYNRIHSIKKEAVSTARNYLWANIIKDLEQIIVRETSYHK